MSLSLTLTDPIPVSLMLWVDTFPHLEGQFLIFFYGYTWKMAFKYATYDVYFCIIWEKSVLL